MEREREEKEKSEQVRVQSTARSAGIVEQIEQNQIGSSLQMPQESQEQEIIAEQQQYRGNKSFQS